MNLRVNKITICGICLVSLFLLLPLFTSADTSIKTIIFRLIDVLKALVPLLVILALVVFIWGVIKYMMAAGDANKRSDAKNIIIFGLIGLFVIVAVWGLVEVIGNTIDVRPGGTIDIPQFNI